MKRNAPQGTSGNASQESVWDWLSVIGEESAVVLGIERVDNIKQHASCFVCGE